MNKVTVGVIAAFGAVVVGWLFVQKPNGAAPARPAASSDAGVAPSASATDVVDLGDDPPMFDLDAGVDDIELDLDAGFEMPDGGKLPDLSDAPKSVHFGVVLVQYVGAEGAKAGVRSYDEAKQLADELAQLAREDFAAAVKKGDEGSTEEAGRMFRNILEPAPEAVLFSLNDGDVSDPVDTPRGFWIIKRIK